jgi:hypothetical protein
VASYFCEVVAVLYFRYRLKKFGTFNLLPIFCCNGSVTVTNSAILNVMKTLLLLSTKSNQYILQVMGTDLLKYGASSDFVTIPKELYKNRVKIG